jgi:NhaP-type Na+/H+ or K+/H+ antiporter
MEALAIITSISVLLLIGIVASVLARKFLLPDVLVLIVLGIVFGFIEYQGRSLFEFPALFLATVSILTLALIVFDSSVMLRLRDLDVYSWKALKLVLVFSLLVLIVFSAVVHFALGVSVWLAVLFAVIVIGTSPEVVLPLLSGSRGVSLNILKLESVFNTPLSVVLPFVIIDWMHGAPSGAVQEIIGMMVPFLAKLVAGIGAGIFVGIILFKLTQKRYSPIYSPLAVIVAAMITYVLAENLAGDGVIAVTTLGVFFGNAYLKQNKLGLFSAESVLTKALLIFVFILVGITIKIPLTVDFFITSVILFLAYLIIRFIAVSISFREFDFRINMLMSLICPKGISTIVVVFILAIHNLPGALYFVPGVSIVLDFTLMFILLSVVVSSLVAWQYKKVIGN